jgi:hypothetical protein
LGAAAFFSRLCIAKKRDYKVKLKNQIKKKINIQNFFKSQKNHQISIHGSNRKVAKNKEKYFKIMTSIFSL